jgi:hypothetical protein
MGSPEGYWTGEGLVATSPVAEATLYVANAGSVIGRLHEKVTRWLGQQLVPAAQIAQSQTSSAGLA